jgi:hypothetical protein
MPILYFKKICMPIVFIVALIVVVLTVIAWLRINRLKAAAGKHGKTVPDREMPEQEKQNDKLVRVAHVTHDDIRKVIAAFCNMYNKEAYMALPRLAKTSDGVYHISFPYDVDIDVFCFFVNYMAYPIELKWQAEVTGWATVAADDDFVKLKDAPQKAMFYLSDVDTEGDNVFITTQHNTGYKQDFGGNTIALSHPEKGYRPAPAPTGDMPAEQEDFK